MLEAKNIFIPRNPDRFDDLKKPYLDMGYKSEEIHIGNIVNQIYKLKGIKVVIGDVAFKNSEIYFFDLEIVSERFYLIECKLRHQFKLPKIVGGDVYFIDNDYYPLNHMDPFFCKKKIRIFELNSQIEKCGGNFLGDV